MTLKNRITAWTAVAAVGAGILAAPLTAKASEEGRRNTALALGAATVYFMLNKRPTEALIGAGATAYAAKLLQDDINKRHQREKQAAAANAYRRGAANAGSSGRYTASYARSTSAPARNTSSAANKAREQQLISSAYRKGLNEGYNQGYRKGLQEAFQSSTSRAQTSSMQGSAPSRFQRNTASTLDRVRYARG